MQPEPLLSPAEWLALYSLDSMSEELRRCVFAKMWVVARAASQDAREVATDLKVPARSEVEAVHSLLSLVRDKSTDWSLQAELLAGAGWEDFKREGADEKLQVSLDSGLPETLWNNLGTNAWRFLCSAARRIIAAGSCTLGDVATDLGEEIGSVRAYHRNMSRTLNTIEVEAERVLPGSWDAEEGQVVYTMDRELAEGIARLGAEGAE